VTPGRCCSSNRRWVGCRIAVSTLLQYVDVERVFRFLHAVESQCRRQGVAVPFLVITVVWVVVMLVLYGLFLLTKPADITYDPWVHASVFAVPMVGFLGHVLQQALAGGHRE
jgi:hypothetical protein